MLRIHRLFYCTPQGRLSFRKLQAAKHKLEECAWALDARFARCMRHRDVRHRQLPHPLWDKCENLPFRFAGAATLLPPQAKTRAQTFTFPYLGRNVVVCARVLKKNGGMLEKIIRNGLAGALTESGTGATLADLGFANLSD